MATHLVDVLKIRTSFCWWLANCFQKTNDSREEEQLCPTRGRMTDLKVANVGIVELRMSGENSADVANRKPEPITNRRHQTTHEHYLAVQQDRSFHHAQSRPHRPDLFTPTLSTLKAASVLEDSVERREREKEEEGRHCVDQMHDGDQRFPSLTSILPTVSCIFPLL